MNVCSAKTDSAVARVGPGLAQQRPTNALAGSVLFVAQLSDAIRARVSRHCEAAYPLEACGVLIGLGDGVAMPWRVTRSVAAVNRGDHRRYRYLIEPEFQLSAEREAQRDGEEVVGYYHSHPDGAALPSALDRQHAWPGYLYGICSVVKARTIDLALFALSDPSGPFCRVGLQPRPGGRSILEAR